MREKSASTKKVEVQAKAEIKKVRSSLNLDLDLSLSVCLSRATILLCMATVFGFFIFVNELLEFIELGLSDILK